MRTHAYKPFEAKGEKQNWEKKIDKKREN